MKNYFSKFGATVLFCIHDGNVRLMWLFQS